MNTELPFRLLFLAAMVAGLSVSAYYRRRAELRQDDEIDYSHEGKLWLVLRRVFGWLLLLTTLTYILRPRWLDWASVPLPDWVRYAGGAWALLVTPPLAVWIFRSLGDNITRTVVTRKQATLVTSGPYRWVRHPLYTMGYASWLALALLAANWALWLIISVLFVILAVRTPKEEARLVERFGDAYRAYMQRTGRYLPRLAR